MREFNNSWQVKSLGEIAFITAGQGAPQGDENFSDKGYPFIRAGSLEKLIDGRNYDQLEKIEEEIAKKNHLKLFSKGCILFAKSGMSSMKDRVIVLKSSAYVVSHLAVIQPNENLDSKYFAYWLGCFKPSRLIKDESYPSISLDAVAKIKIPLPPLSIQRQIAEILEKADQAKQKRKEANKLTDEFLQSVFIEMFGDPVKNPKGWKIIKLEDCIEYIGDIGSNGSNENVAKNLEMFDKENYAIMIRTVNLSANDFKNNLKYISKTTYDYFSKSKIYGGEIIMNKIGSAGDFWIMPKLEKPVSLGLNQLMIRLKDLNTFYLYYYLSTHYCRKIIKSLIRGAITKSITKSAVKNLPLLYPPLSFQQKFAELVNETEALKEKQKQSEQELENLFQSLMQKAFKGELTN